MEEQEIDVSFSDLLFQLRIMQPDAILASHKIERNLSRAELSSARFSIDEDAETELFLNWAQQGRKKQKHDKDEHL